MALLIPNGYAKINTCIINLINNINNLNPIIPILVWAGAWPSLSHLYWLEGLLLLRVPIFSSRSLRRCEHLAIFYRCCPWSL